MRVRFQRAVRLLVPSLLLVSLLVASARSLAQPVLDADAPSPTALLGELSLTCDLPECSEPAFIERLRGVAGLAVGERVTRSMLADAYGRIAETTYFARCTPDERWQGDRVDVSLTCAGATVIRDVRVRAGTALGSEIRRRIFLRSGQPWEADSERIGRQQREIERYFEERGYFGTEVRIAVRDVEPFVVDLTFEIHRGQRASVNQVYLRGVEAMSYGEARATLLSEFNLVRTYTSERFDLAQQALVERYRGLGYIQARVSLDEVRIDPERGTVDLFVEVREGTRWDVRFTGNRLFNREQLLAALSFYQTGFVDDAEIAAAVRQLRALYETVGHVFADISVTEVATSDGSRALSFRIDEQPPSEIREVRFSGVTMFSEAFLRSQIETSAYDILAAGGYLQRTRLDNDIRTIIQLYRGLGFPDATVTRVVLVGENGGRDLYVTLHIDEGPQTLLSSIEVTGVPDARALEQVIATRRAAAPTTEGVMANRPVFDDVGVVEDQAALLRVVQEQGFPAARVDVQCVDPTTQQRDDIVPCPQRAARSERLRSLADDSVGTCERQRRAGRIVEECRLVVPTEVAPSAPPAEGRQVALRYVVDRGPTVRLADWFVRGGFTTRPRVIERELQLERGATFRYQDLLDAQSRLRATRLFDSVRVRTIDEGALREQAHLVVQLEERGARSLEHRVSLSARIASTEQLLVVLANAPTFRDVNILGSGSELRVFGTFDFDVREPARLEEGQLRGSVGVAYIDPRLYLTRRMRDPWEWVNALTYTYDLLALPPAPLTKEIAFRTSVREEFDAIPGLFLGAELALRRTLTVDQSDVAAVSDVFEPALVFALTPRVTYEGRDNPLHPSRGTFAELEVELADDFIGVLNSARYTRVETRVAGFVPLGEQERFVLGLNGRFGFAVGGLLNGFRSSSAFALPVAERFRLGGVTSLRGFADGEISSTDVDGFGGDVLVGANVELRYPFLRNIDLEGAVFLDVGQLSRGFDELALDGFRASTGFGLRWVIADLIPLLFDYGAVLNRQSGERFGRFHLNIGYTF